MEFNVLQATINGDTMEYITSFFWIELDLRFVDDSCASSQWENWK
jgi:hypothetical protein